MIYFLILLSIPASPIFSQNIPQPDFQIHNITLGGNLNRFYFQLSDNTFTDVEDINIKNLKLEFSQINGNAILTNNWVQFKSGTNQLIGYVNDLIIRNQPRFGYEYLLTATDSDGNVGKKIFNFKGEQRRKPYYKRQLKLKSSSSIVFVRNDVENLFNIQEEKLLPYSLQNGQGITNVKFFITDELSITNTGSGERSISLTWSTSTFISNDCKVEDIISLRSKTIGSYQNQYQALFNPLYQYESVSEIFTGVCSYLSIDPPQIGSAVLNTFSISYGQMFSFTIASNTFLPPISGSSMPLSLELRTSTGESVGTTSWINLVGTSLAQGSMLQGFISYEEASKQTNYQFQLVAKTPLHEENMRLINVRVDNVQVVYQNFVVSFVSSTLVTSSYASFIQSFITTLSSYLSVDSSNVVVYSYKNEQSSTQLQWTLSTLSSSSDCDAETVSEYTSKLIDSNGQLNMNLQNQLNGIGFLLADIEISTASGCNKPLIKQALGSLVFTWGTFFRYVILDGAYVDAKDGSNLQFSLVQSGDTFSSANWLSINSNTRTIYGVPILSNLQTGVKYEFTLRITNSQGEFVDDVFFIQSDTAPPDWSYMYRFQIQFATSYTSVAAVMSSFFNKLYIYFGDSNQGQLLISEVVTIISDRRMDIMYYNSSFRITPCDTQAQIAANMKLFDGRSPNSALVTAMSPDFTVTEITSERKASCQVNLYPSISPQRVFEGELGPHVVKWGGYFMKKLSEDLFQDEEDGDTYAFNDISLKLSTSNFPLSLSSWVYYDHTTFTVYAVSMDFTFQLLGSNQVVKYILRAVDSGGHGVNGEYIMQPTGSVSNMYMVTYTMRIFNIASSSNAFQLITMYEDLWKMLGTNYEGNMCIRNYQVTNVIGNSADATLTWTPCDLPVLTCDFDKINTLRSLIFIAGTTELNTKFKQRYTNFQIINVVDSGSDLCEFNPPAIGFQIPLLQISFCGLFTYQLPDNTFIDAEDGTTKNLQLTMKGSNDQALTSSSWFQFDSNTRRIHALLTQDMFTSGQFQSTQSFTLTATDKSKLSTSQTITVAIIGGAILTDYKVILQVQISGLAANANPFISLAQKIGFYFGDQGKGFEAIRSSLASDGSTIFEFGNCSLPYSPCQPVELQAYKTMLKNNDGTWKQSFMNTLQPEFNQRFISDDLKGPCANDEAPQLINQWGPLQITITKTYVYKVPENTFFDKEQGNTRNLQLELTNLSSQSIYWLSFDSISQTITIIATRDIGTSLQPTSKLTVRLTAYDINRKSAYQDLDIIVGYPDRQASHYFSMQLLVKSPLNNAQFVNVYTVLRTRIEQYFGDSLSIGTVSFHSLTTSFQTTITVVWSNSTISTTQCENNKINYILTKVFTTIDATTVNPQFTAALSTSFTMINTQFYYDGACKDERTPPTLVNPIPAIEITFCEGKDYIIPVNTFNDAVDGNTRQLILLLTTAQGSVLNDNSFVALDEVSQTIIITPYASAFTDTTFPQRYTFQLRATNSRALSVSTYVYVDINQAPSMYSYSFQMSGVWLGNSDISFAAIIREYQKKTSTYLGYQDGNDISIIEALRSEQSSSAFSIKATSCQLNYNPCDTNKIRNIQTKLFDNLGNTFNNAFSTSLQPNIRILQLSDMKDGPCKAENKPPVQNQAIPSITVKTCSTLNYQLPAETFQDPEDGFQLNYVITMINGKAVDTSTTWIYQTTNKEILAVVNNDVLESSQNNAYQITVRAFDREQLFVDAIWKVFVSGQSHQTFYKIQLDLTANTELEQQFIERYYISKFINDFYGASYTNFISMQYLSNRRVLFTWSSCSLPDYCDPNAANIFFLNMKVENRIVEEFQKAFESRYVLNDVTMSVEGTCSKPLNPPRPKQNMWSISFNQCGGLSQVIPNDMFYDSEDGDINSLTLLLTQVDNTPIPSWIYYDQATKTIHGIPTRDEAMNQNTNLRLTAIDSTGLSAYISISFVITIPAEPQYIFLFQYSVTSSQNIEKQRVTEAKEFTEKLATFLGSSTSSIALQGYTEESTTERIYKYANCSISYNPCDIASLQKIKNQILTNNNFPQPSFSTFMQPNFNIRYGLTEAKKTCDGSTPSPPKVTIVIGTLNIPLCGYFQYRIPEDTFYDSQDGNTRFLKLSLSKSNGEMLTSVSWIQFNTQTQTIYAIPTAKETLASSNGFSYTLTALDTSQLPAQTSVSVKVNGDANSPSDCKIRMDFTTTDTLSNQVERLQFIIEKMSTYFQVSANEIVIVDYKQVTTSSFQMYWSLCSTSNDLSNFATKILMKLFIADRTTVQTSFKSIFGGDYTLQNAMTQFSGKCQNIPPIVTPGNTEIKITLSTCGYVQRSLANTMFYDYEDGDTSNLQLSMYQSNGITPLAFDSWINVDETSKSIVMRCDDEARKLTPGRYTVILKATDSMGESARVNVILEKFQINNNPLSPFDITFEIKYNGRVRPTAYESMVVMQKIASYYQLSGTDQILIKAYVTTNTYAQQRRVTWTSCNYQSCTSNILSKTKSLYTSSGELVTSFTNMFLNDFTVYRAYFTSSSCDPPTVPPTPSQDVPQPPQLQYCSMFTFQLPYNLLYDYKQGDMRQLIVNVLDSNGNALSKNSFLRLNPATLQMYGINIQSQSMRSPTYRISASNSALLTGMTSISFQNSETPYIADCPITMMFQYRYQTLDTNDLDILWLTMTTIQQYYKDSSNMIKVLKFEQQSNGDYLFQWSNCSFVFDTLEQANAGLSESDREKIQNIFSKVINTNTQQVNPAFESAMSQSFQISSIEVSYKCIETKPYPGEGSILSVYPRPCEVFKKMLPNELFRDDKDGDIRNMELSLTYTNGQEVNSDEWIQLNTENKNKQFLYAVVTSSVLANKPSDSYKYLVKCTDSSGRSATMSLVVYVVQQTNSYPNTFVIGFRNTVAENNNKPSAYILGELTTKISQFIDSEKPNKLFVEKFNIESFIEFSQCDLQCDESTFNNIFNKLQTVRYQTTPTYNLIQALLPNFDVNYMYISAPTCYPNNDEEVTPQPCAELQFPACGYFSTTLPSRCYKDSYGRDTRSFQVNVKEANGASLNSNSWLQFDPTKQMYYGIPIWNQISSEESIQVAVTHPASGKQVTTSKNIKIQDYSSVSSLNGKICQVTSSYSTIYSSAYDDVTIIKKLLEKISSFQKTSTDLSSYQILNFNRNENIISLTYSNCTWITLLQSQTSSSQYLQEVLRVMQQYFILTGTTIVDVKPSFREHLKPEFEFRDVQTTSSCTTIPVSPPIPNRDLRITLDKSCGKFQFQIPEDMFTDPKYGNTRELTLKLLSQTNQPLMRTSWVNVNTNQVLYGIIGKSVSVNQPLEGYQFRLQATNKDGQSASTRVFLKLPNKQWVTEIITLKVTTTVGVLPSFDIDYQLPILTQIDSYPNFASLQDQLYVESVTSINSLYATINYAYCQQCDQVYYTNMKASQKTPSSLKSWIGSKTTVVNTEYSFANINEMNSICTDAKQQTSYKINFELCNNNVYLLSNLFTNYIEEIPQLQLVNIDNQPISATSWLTLTTNPYRLIAYPTKEIMLGQQGLSKHGFPFRLRFVIDGTELSNGQQINITISEKSSSDLQKYTLTVTDRNNNIQQSNNHHISQIWQITSSYLGGDRSFQHSSFTRINSNSNTFTVSWYDCALPCGDQDVETINSKLFSNGKISEAYRQSFPSNYQADTLVTSCSNSPPTVNKTLTLSIPSCGYYSYKLPNDFAYDTADGYLDNLAVEMRNVDGSEISRTSWIQFDTSKKEIMASVTEAAQNSVPPQGYRYMLYVTDSTQKTSTSTLYVNIPSEQKAYLNHVVHFSSRYSQTTTYLELQRRMMNVIGDYINNVQLDDYRSLSFTSINSVPNGNEESYYYKMANCSVPQYICNIQSSSLTELASRFSQAGQAAPSFISYVNQATQGMLRIQQANVEAFYTIDNPPQIVQTERTVTVDYCTGNRFDTPQTMFNDEEDITELSYVLYMENGNIVPSNFWLGLSHIDNQNDVTKEDGKTYLYVMPLTTTARGKTTYKITATDKCGQTTTSTLNVVLTGQPTEPSYSILLRFQAKNIVSRAVEMWNIQQNIKKCYGNVVQKIRTESFVYVNNLIEYRWSNLICDLKTCNQQMMDLINTKTFSSPNIVSETLKQCFAPSYILYDATESRSKICEKPNPNPPIVSSPLPKLYVKFCEKMEYTIPVNTFVDNEDGTTRSLTLELLTDNLQSLPKTEWLQFNQNTQTIYGYPRSTLKMTEVRRNYVYKLKATDSSGSYTITDVVIEIRERDLSLDYYMCLYLTRSDANRPNIDEEIELLSSLKTYFNEGDLNDISYTRSGNNIVFKYSFCNMPTDVCTCNQLRRYQEMINPTNMLADHLSPGYTVTKITSETQASCLKNKKPVVDKGIPVMDIPIGDCYSNTIPANAFYDEEEGNTRQLDLRLMDANNQEITRTFWLQLEDQKICRLIPFKEFESYKYPINRDTLYEYNIVAYDDCMNSVPYKTTSRLSVKGYFEKRYYLLFMVLDMNEGDLRSNCQLLDRLLVRLSGYTKHNKTDIFIDDIYTYNNTATNYTEIVWGYRDYSKNCSNETITISRKYFVNGNEADPKFIEYMKPDFDVIEVREEKSKDCVVTVTSLLLFGDNEDDFPWWILWLLLALALLFLFLWLLWLCCRNCCPTCFDGCMKCCGATCCGTCCKKFCGTNPSKKYETFEESPYGSPNVAPKPNDVTGGVLAQPRDETDGRVAPRPNNNGSEPFGDVLAKPRDEDSEEEPAVMAAPVMMEEVEPDFFSDPDESPDDDSPVEGDILAMPRDENSPTPKVLPRKPVSEASYHMTEQKNVEAEVEYNFSESEKSTKISRLPILPQPQTIRTESYTDKRNIDVERRLSQPPMVTTSTRRDFVTERQAPISRIEAPITRTERNVFVERYADRKPRHIVIDEYSEEESDLPIIVKERKRAKVAPILIEEKRTKRKPIIVEERRKSKPLILEETRPYRSSRKYRYADALVDTPIVMEVKDRSIKRRHTRNNSDGDALLIKARRSLRSKRRSISPIHRLKRRSKSPVRRKSRPITLRVEEPTSKTYIRTNRGHVTSSKHGRDLLVDSSHHKTRSRGTLDHRDLTLHFDSDDGFGNEVNNNRMSTTMKSYIVNATHARGDARNNDEQFFTLSSKRRDLESSKLDTYLQRRLNARSKDLSTGGTNSRSETNFRRKTVARRVLPDTTTRGGTTRTTKYVESSRRYDVDSDI